MYLVKIRKTVCFEHNVQEFVVLFFGHLLAYQNSFDNFLSRGSTDATCEVWCNSVKLPRRSSKKVSFSFVVVLPMKSYRKNGRGLHHTIQLNTGNIQDLTMCCILCGSYGPKMLLCGKWHHLRVIFGV